MPTQIFITGTDTDVGKTYITIGLLKALRAREFTVMGIKPIASGAVERSGQLFNADAEALQAHSSQPRDYTLHNPFVFKDPIAPHLAAETVKQWLSVAMLNESLKSTFNSNDNIQLVEGAGGVLVPLNLNETMLDFVSANQMPILLVVGIKLGCINHAMLTLQAIKNAKLPFVGWIANCCDPDSLEQHGNIQTLKNWLGGPYLGTVPYGENPEKYIDIDALLQNAGVASRKMLNPAIS